MAHFTALFLNDGGGETSAARATLEAGYRDGLREKALHVRQLDGAWLLVSERESLTPSLKRTDDGWVVSTGRMIDLDDAAGATSARRLLDALSAEDDAGINRFEGVFAAIGWHAPTRSGYALNDQASTMSLYLCERPEGLWVSTVALPLARAVGADLDPQGLREFFARGTILSPTTMFRGVRRLEAGERCRVRDGRVERFTHWRPLQEPVERSTRDAAEEISSLLRDRIRRFTPGSDRVIADLTGGYDSRLVVTAAAAEGRLQAVTVDGPQDNVDVQIARKVAREAGWEMRHHDTTTFWNVPVDAPMRRELTYRTGGELAFTEVYHHLLSRPALGRDFGLHLTGGGGELLRGFPWFQEFAGMGRRRRANVHNALWYRFFQEGPPAAGLFAADWHPVAVDVLRERLGSMFDAMPGTRNTQQLDAAYLWRMTGFSPYSSTLNGWMSTVPPLMCARSIDLALGLPWKMRLTAGLMKTITELQVPRVARLRTAYGGTASPPRLGSLHLQLSQLAKSGGHLVLKLDRVKLGGVLSRLMPSGPVATVARKPYVTDEFREFLDPRTMSSRGLYRRQGLEALVEGDPSAIHAREPMILRVATVEQICRETGIEPDPGFLAEA